MYRLILSLLVIASSVNGFSYSVEDARDSYHNAYNKASAIVDEIDKKVEAAREFGRNEAQKIKVRFVKAKENFKSAVEGPLQTADHVLDVSVHVGQNNYLNVGGVAGGAVLLFAGDRIAERAFHFDAKNLLVSDRVGAGDSKYEEAVAKTFKTFGRAGGKMGKWLGKALRLGGILTVLYNGSKIIYSVVSYDLSVNQAAMNTANEVLEADAAASGTVAAHYAEKPEDLFSLRSQFQSKEAFMTYVDAYLKGPDGDKLQATLNGMDLITP